MSLYQPKTLYTFDAAVQPVTKSAAMSLGLQHVAFRTRSILNVCAHSSRLNQPVCLFLSSLTQLRLTLAEPPVWLWLWEHWVGCQGWLSGCHGFPASCWFPVCPHFEERMGILSLCPPTYFLLLALCHALICVPLIFLLFNCLQLEVSIVTVRLQNPDTFPRVQVCLYLTHLSTSALCLDVTVEMNV